MTTNEIKFKLYSAILKVIVIELSALGLVVYGGIVHDFFGYVLIASGSVLLLAPIPWWLANKGNGGKIS